MTDIAPSSFRRRAPLGRRHVDG